MNNLIDIVQTMEHKIEQIKAERDSLINDLTNLRKQRDNYKSRAETLDNLKEYLSEARTLNM
ncbi:hypothetical protein DD924_15255, partial [Staphylococcus pseudintermedius]